VSIAARGADMGNAMEKLLRRLLGLYFIVTSVAYVPAGLFYLGIENTAGPWWILPIIPLTQGFIFAAAGLMLLHGQSAEGIPVGGGVVFPPVESLLQLSGVYFIVEGLSSGVRPGVDMWFVGETWWSRLGNVAGAAVWVLAGWVLVKRPRAIVGLLSRHATT
jgi:hypothetical protein